MGAAQQDAVRRFLEVVEHWSDADAMATLVADDIVYDPWMPSWERKGRAAFLEEIQRQQGHAKVLGIDIRAIASTDRHVFTERVDRFEMAGKEVMLHINAVFEVNDDGKVCAWREYFDGVDLAQSLGIPYDQLAALK
jgi:limonene-1,2-epoxide hydrolase